MAVFRPPCEGGGGWLNSYIVHWLGLQNKSLAFTRAKAPQINFCINSPAGFREIIAQKQTPKQLRKSTALGKPSAFISQLTFSVREFQERRTTNFLRAPVVSNSMLETTRVQQYGKHMKTQPVG